MQNKNITTDLKIKTILKDPHLGIDVAVKEAIITLESPDASYPPGVEFNELEKAALQSVHLTTSLESGLRKIIADACSKPLFQLFCVIDGVGDPSINFGKPWAGLRLTEEEDEKLKKEYNDYSNKIFKEIESMDLIPLEDVFKYTYEEMPKFLKEQLEEYKRYLESEGK